MLLITSEAFRTLHPPTISNLRWMSRWVNQQVRRKLFIPLWAIPKRWIYAGSRSKLTKRDEKSKIFLFIRCFCLCFVLRHATGEDSSDIHRERLAYEGIFHDKEVDFGQFFPFKWIGSSSGFVDSITIFLFFRCFHATGRQTNPEGIQSKNWWKKQQIVEIVFQ